MKPAAERLADYLANITIIKPAIPVIHNVDVVSHENPEEIKSALVNQLFNPVRWVETINSLSDQGVDTLIECGPGKVLVGLNKRIQKNMSALPVFDPDTLDAAKA
jgi:[acyl-carrier-protein] S-malonyltransferase